MTLHTRARALWVVWFAILAGSLFAMVRLNKAATGAVATNNRFGFTLVESAKQLGVDAVHQGPTFDHKLDHIMPQVASVGAAVAVADFDRDGWPDFYVTNSADGSLNHLYRNQGDGTFIDVASAAGVVNGRMAKGVAWGDFDGDGRPEASPPARHQDHLALEIAHLLFLLELRCSMRSASCRIFA